MNTIQQAHILLVDDNTDLLRLLEEQLRGAGYQNIRTVQNCAAAQTAFAAEMPELMILDINLPDGDGFSLFRTCGQSRCADCSLCTGRRCRPLVRAGTGRRRLPDQAISDAGTALRVQHLCSVLTGRASRTNSNLAAGRPERGPARCPCDPAGRNHPCPDSDRADAFAQAGRKPRHIVTYDALCEAVWGADYYGYENSLGVHIRHLREKLEPEPGRPRFLQTVRGIGYKLAKEDAR